MDVLKLLAVRRRHPEATRVRSHAPEGLHTVPRVARVFRSRLIWQIAPRPMMAMARVDVQLTLTSVSPYAAVAGAAAVTSLLLRNYLYRIQEDGLLITADPFSMPLYGGVLLLAVFTAVLAATATARDREHGAVELLCYGPVTPLSYLVAKGVAHTVIYALLLALLLVTFSLMSLVSGLHLRPLTLVAAALSIGPAAATTAIGLLTASGMRRVRPTVLMVLGLALAGVGLPVAREVLARLPAADFHVHPLLILRWAAFAVSSVTQWVLPFGHVERQLAAVLRGDYGTALAEVGLSAAYAAVGVAVAAAILYRTGVRR